ncbi:MoaD/ThiS family protein [Leucobacter sp. HY1908]
MSQITVRYFAAAAEAAGLEEEPWAATTLAVLRAGLTDKYGEPMAQVLRAGSFLVDGVVRRDDGLIAAPADETGAASGVGAATHRSGITVDVLPPFAGG